VEAVVGQIVGRIDLTNYATCVIMKLVGVCPSLTGSDEEPVYLWGGLNRTSS